MQEETHPGEIIIEIEKVEIDAAHAGEANENELLGHIGDNRVQTSNLPVKAIAVRSVLATEDDEDGFASRTGLFASFFPAAQPARPIFGSQAAATQVRQTENARQQPTSSAHWCPPCRVL